MLPRVPRVLPLYLLELDHLSGLLVFYFKALTLSCRSDIAKKMVTSFFFFFFFFLSLLLSLRLLLLSFHASCILVWGVFPDVFPPLRPFGPAAGQLRHQQAGLSSANGLQQRNISPFLFYLLFSSSRNWCYFGLRRPMDSSPTLT